MFDLIGSNSFCEHGIVVAIQHAPLGNAICAMANVAELTRRTRVTSVYPDLMRTSARDLCKNAAHENFIVNGPCDGIDMQSLLNLVDELSSVFGGSGALPGFTSKLRKPRQLTDLRHLQRKVIVTLAPQEFESMAKVEDDLSTLCSQGNIIILNGAYWLQYFPTDTVDISALRQKLELGKKHHLRASVVGKQPVIAVHMRLGEDYTRWHAGAYHFPVSDYEVVIRAMVAWMPEAKIEIFSDRLIDSAAFSGLERIGSHPGASVDDDFYDLTGCDLIVGPPSTFATSASFLGKRRRLILTKERIAALQGGERPESMISHVESPTFSYAPGVYGPL